LATKSGVVGPGADRTDIQRRGRKIIFSVVGCHTTEAAVQATHYLVALVTEINGSVEFIADLRDITGFTMEGRKYWQEAFKQVRSRITLITMVKGTALARMTASAVGL